MSASPAACDFWNLYKNSNYLSANDNYNYNNYSCQEAYFNRTNYQYPYADYCVKNDEDKYQHINQSYVQEHFIPKTESTTTSQLTLNGLGDKSEYLNQFDSCRQAIYNNSTRLSPRVNDIVTSNSSKKEGVKPDTTDSPTLRALLSKPKKEKPDYSFQEQMLHNQNFSNNAEYSPKTTAACAFSPEAAACNEDYNMQNGSPPEIETNTFYPWMKTSSQGNYFIYNNPF